MNEYKCNHCKQVIKHDGNYSEIGMIEVLVRYPEDVSGLVLYHEECAKEIARELLELV